MRCSILLLFTVALAGCTGPSGESDVREETDAAADAAEPLFASVQAIFDHSCAVATTQCHNEGNMNHLRLDRGFATTETIGVPSFEVPRVNRITPGDSSASYLYLKLQESTLHSIPECPNAFPPACGSTMPAAPFSVATAAEIELIRRWIDEGAVH